MKYQLIIETAEYMTDQEFRERMLKKGIPSYQIVMARNIDDIRPEVVPFLEDDLADIL